MRKVFITTDIGGGDPDDYQSLIHALLYSTEIEITGIACGYPRGKKSAALDVIRAYERDYPKLSPHGYPTPTYFRSRTHEGSNTKFKKGVYSNGAKALVNEAKAHIDPTPLIVTCWGSPTELAEALHLNGEMLVKKIFAFISGDWNRDQDNDAYHFCVNYPGLRYISCMSTHRGIYLTGINGQQKYGNVGFVKQVIRGAGYLGKLFYKMSENININKYGLKMGDTPSFLWAIKGDLNDPTTSSWGGSYRRLTLKAYADKLHASIGIYKGAKTVSTHKREILMDFEDKLELLR